MSRGCSLKFKSTSQSFGITALLVKCHLLSILAFSHIFAAVIFKNSKLLEDVLESSECHEPTSLPPPPRVRVEGIFGNRRSVGGVLGRICRAEVGSVPKAGSGGLTAVGKGWGGWRRRRRRPHKKVRLRLWAPERDRDTEIAKRWLRLTAQDSQKKKTGFPRFDRRISKKAVCSR